MRISAISCGTQDFVPTRVGKPKGYRVNSNPLKSKSYEYDLVDFKGTKGTFLGGAAGAILGAVGLTLSIATAGMATPIVSAIATLGSIGGFTAGAVAGDKIEENKSQQDK